MLIQIPDEKVQELLYFLNEESKRKKITLRQLQSLCGSLAFCARALPAGRAFSRRLYLACDRARKPHYLIKITKAKQIDILTWKMLLEKSNGFSYILNDSWVSNSVLKHYTDSAGGVSIGCGIYFDGKWACLN